MKLNNPPLISAEPGAWFCQLLRPDLPTLKKCVQVPGSARPEV